MRQVCVKDCPTESYSPYLKLDPPKPPPVDNDPLVKEKLFPFCDPDKVGVEVEAKRSIEVV